MERYRISGVPDHRRRAAAWSGILTNRDLRFEDDHDAARHRS